MHRNGWPSVEKQLKVSGSTCIILIKLVERQKVLLRRKEIKSDIDFLRNLIGSQIEIPQFQRTVIVQWSLCFLDDPRHHGAEQPWGWRWGLGLKFHKLDEIKWKT